MARVNARDFWNTSFVARWHDSLPRNTTTSIRYGESRSCTRARRVSRAKGLSTFKKSPIHFCNHRAYDRSGAQLIRLCTERSERFSTPGMAFSTVTYIGPLYTMTDGTRVSAFWIADYRTKVPRSGRRSAQRRDDRAPWQISRHRKSRFLFIIVTQPRLFPLSPSVRDYSRCLSRLSHVSAAFDFYSLES